MSNITHLWNATDLDNRLEVLRYFPAGVGASLSTLGECFVGGKHDLLTSAILQVFGGGMTRLPTQQSGDGP